MVCSKRSKSTGQTCGEGDCFGTGVLDGPIAGVDEDIAMGKNHDTLTNTVPLPLCSEIF